MVGFSTIRLQQSGNQATDTTCPASPHTSCCTLVPYLCPVQTFRIEANVSSITNLAISPSEDQLALTTSNNQIYRCVGWRFLADSSRDTIMLYLCSSRSWPGPVQGTKTCVLMFHDHLRRVRCAQTSRDDCFAKTTILSFLSAMLQPCLVQHGHLERGHHEFREDGGAIPYSNCSYASWWGHNRGSLIANHRRLGGGVEAPGEILLTELYPECQSE